MKKWSLNIERAIEQEYCKRGLCLSQISLLEIAYILKKENRTTDEISSWIQAACLTELIILPISAEISAFAVTLEWRRNVDPADRAIVATAVRHELMLLSCDKKIHRVAGQYGLIVER
jgi:PIN domain nuclease of toxin-antitoxin system